MSDQVVVPIDQLSSLSLSKGNLEVLNRSLEIIRRNELEDDENWEINRLVMHCQNLAYEAERLVDGAYMIDSLAQGRLPATIFKAEELLMQISLLRAHSHRIGYELAIDTPHNLLNCPISYQTADNHTLMLAVHVPMTQHFLDLYEYIPTPVVSNEEKKKEHYVSIVPRHKYIAVSSDCKLFQELD